MDVNHKKIGQEILKARLDNKISQKEAALKMGISPNSLSRIERGEMKLSIEALLNICDIHDINIDYFLRDFIGCNSNFCEELDNANSDVLKQFSAVLLKKNNIQKEKFLNLLRSYKGLKN